VRDLFDGHREPSDQLREFIEMLGIVVLDGLREPEQAFVVAQQRHIAWHDRGRGLHRIAHGHQIDLGHLVTLSRESGIGSVGVE
ncbi:MAG TPA: hypothetical protein VGJ16_09195, partial [Pirellulales bacterium]